MTWPELVSSLGTASQSQLILSISFLSFLNQFFILEEISVEAGLAYYKFSLVFLSNTCIAVFELEAKTIS